MKDACNGCKLVALLNENLEAKKELLKQRDEIVKLLKGNIQPVKIKKKEIRLSPN